MDEKERFIQIIWPQVSQFLHECGGWRYDGYLGGTKQGWLGPYIWNEDGDLKRIITRYCENEFGCNAVHNESKIDKFRYANFQHSENDERESVDIDITDATGCKNAESFRQLKHSLFIEVKHISKGKIFNDARKKIEGFLEDCRKLSHQVKYERVKHAIAVLVDDGDLDQRSYIQQSEGGLDSLNRETAKYEHVTPLIWILPRT